MRLRNRLAGEALAPVVVVALRASEIQLALPTLKQRSACIQLLVIGLNGYRLDVILSADISREREELAAFVGEGRLFLPLDPAGVDLLLEVAKLTALHCRIARGDALHALVAARAVRLEQRLAVHQGEQRRVRGLVVLH